MVLTHSASAFLHDALMIPAAISSVRSVSASTTVTLSLCQPVCQPGSLTMPSAVLLQLFFIYQVKPGTKHRPMTFLYRMTIYCVGDIQSQAYKIQGFKFFLLIFLFF